jgi:hypothetical protein
MCGIMNGAPKDNAELSDSFWQEIGDDNFEATTCTEALGGYLRIFGLDADESDVETIEFAAPFCGQQRTGDRSHPETQDDGTVYYPRLWQPDMQDASVNKCALQGDDEDTCMDAT